MFFKDLRSVLNVTVVVAGLGYFVDLFDITLFGVVRSTSLRDLGITDPELILRHGITIYNAQAIGMILGGLLWGVLADKKGRLSIMFASILLYSLANIANAFVWDVTSYAVCRFLGGLGLAGELGAAVTLVAESLPKDKRGLGTTVVATLGMLGIVVAALTGQLLHWKTSYILGGVLGLLLLVTRFKISESSLFANQTAHSSASDRGNLKLLLQPRRFAKYICCVAVGMPIYFTTGVLLTFAPELTSGLNVVGTVSAGNAILFGSIGLTIGDLLSGALSHVLKSRKRAVFSFLLSGFLLFLFYVSSKGISSTTVYFLSFFIGLTVGYWAVLITIAAEQFGTNIRATVATSVPNFVRGTGILAVSGFGLLKTSLPAHQAALLIGTACFVSAIVALYFLEETFKKDLDFIETR